jgi:hypothetical protein
LASGAISTWDAGRFFSSFLGGVGNDSDDDDDDDDEEELEEDSDEEDDAEDEELDDTFLVGFFLAAASLDDLDSVFVAVLVPALDFGAGLSDSESDELLKSSRLADGAALALVAAGLDADLDLEDDFLSAELDFEEEELSDESESDVESLEEDVEDVEEDTLDDFLVAVEDPAAFVEVFEVDFDEEASL